MAGHPHLATLGSKAAKLRYLSHRERKLEPQNAALTENTTWLPAMLDPSLVEEKLGSR
jgi:hypothetical protein